MLSKRSYIEIQHDKPDQPRDDAIEIQIDEPNRFNPDAIGKFDYDLENFTTAKGIEIKSSLVRSPLKKLFAKNIKSPAYIRQYDIPSLDVLNELTDVIKDNITDQKCDSSGYLLSPKLKFNQKLKSYRGSYWVYAYYHLINERVSDLPDNQISHNVFVPECLRGKSMRSESGVIVNTITLSPFPLGKSSGDGDTLNSFSCKFNCYFCPNQPGVPRSYLAEEPAVLRGISAKYHPVSQTFDRLSALFLMGHPVDKIEVKYIGGTWSSFPLLYRKWVTWQTYLAHNIFYTAHDQELDLTEFDPEKFTSEQLDQLIEEAQCANASSFCRIIGLTVETRPDCVDRVELALLRQFGCTRIEMGVQHTSDDILRLINRGHLLIHAKKAIKLCKDHGFKIVIHLMPQLPGSNPEIDCKMINTVIDDLDLQVDEWKLYNCEVTPYTEIYKWYRDGTYRPYSDEELKMVYIATLPRVPEYIRIDRLKRDIPSNYTIAGLKDGGFRNKVFDRLNGTCMEMRSREIKGREISSWKIEELEYQSSGAKEFFISVKDQNGMLCGFCRLRLNDPNQPLLIPELESLRLKGPLALIRELHVYGTMAGVGVDTTHSNTQHRGFGQSLVKKAESIAYHHGYTNMAIIAGVGTRLYYRDRLNYTLMDTYMVGRVVAR